jgi:hypothetical protein
VIVEAKINDRGTVDDVKVLKALPFGTLGDQPVPVVVNLVVNFPSDEVKPVK